MAPDQYNPIPLSAALASGRHELAGMPIYLPTADTGPVLYRQPSQCASQADFQRLSEHGVRHILIRRDDYHRCEQLWESRLQDLAQDDSLPPNAKASIVQQVGTTVANDILDGGIGPDTMGRASNVISAVIHAILSDACVANHLLAMATHERTMASHMFIVSALSVVLGRAIFGADESMLTTLGMSGMAHDLGKLALNREILNKPGPLSVEEIRRIQQHPVESVRLLGNESSATPAVRQTILQHHERIDGRGYPLGLSGDDLLPTSCILSIVDSFHAMVGRRRYRDSLTPAAATRALLAQRGRQFHSEFLDHWSRLIDDLGPMLAQEGPAGPHEILAFKQEHQPMAQFEQFGKRPPRFKCRDNVEVRCVYVSRLHNATCAPDEFESRASDVSKGGICFRTDFPMYRGERISLQLPGSRQVWIEGVIAWCRRDAQTWFKAGVCFERRADGGNLTI